MDTLDKTTYGLNKFIEKSEKMNHIKISLGAILLGFIIILMLKLFIDKQEASFEKATSDAQNIVAMLDLGIVGMLPPHPLCQEDVVKNSREASYRLHCVQAGTTENLLQQLYENNLSLAVVPLRDYLAKGGEAGFPATIIAVVSASGDESVPPNVLLARRELTEEHPKVVTTVLKNYFSAQANIGSSDDNKKTVYSLQENAEKWFGIGDTHQEGLIGLIERELKHLHTPKLPDKNPYRLTNQVFVQTLAESMPIVVADAKPVPESTRLPDVPILSDGARVIDNEFRDIYNELSDLIGGALGKILMMALIITGAFMGVVRESLTAAIPGFSVALVIYYMPLIIESILLLQ